MSDRNIGRVQELAQKYYARQDATGWFEELYSLAEGDIGAIPWAKLTVNPHLADWLEQNRIKGQGRTALVIGCGLGDDAEALANFDFEVTAFDVSHSAIAWCNRRFPNSSVNYLRDDLLQPQVLVGKKFDFVLEAYTIQALPADIRIQAIANIPRFLAPDGKLLVICRGREIDEPANELPYPLTKTELAYFEELGLQQVSFEECGDSQVRRFRIVYTK
ncbi:bifunctional 2-polyprenyl-6-hydroxyphenol methylase/3-demethylubiquinol 3-O-methyltransferase UbiG [Myxosarcina sp. GI1]|uniref:class I SAM-dependent methyltransferase n=1 Tax=Myxosarcina sp. GI1 TaxID=1541065 RepID=UPI000565DA6E|nr:class I SAM-dependent methyltransferase [Myxosarcina sp. GI1]